MNDNLIERLSEEWANLDPVDPLLRLEKQPNTN